MLKLEAKTVIFVFWEPATAVDGETALIVGTSFVAKAPTQPVITPAVKIADKTKLIRYMSFPTF